MHDPSVASSPDEDPGSVDRNLTSASRLRVAPGTIAGVLVLLLAAWILQSFAAPLAWAVIVAVASWPAYRRFAACLPTWMASNLTPLVFTALVSLLVLAPLALALVAVAAHAQTWAQQVVLADQAGLATPRWLSALPVVGAGLADRWHAMLGTPGGVTLWWRQADEASALQWVQRLGQFLVHHVYIVSLTVVVLFFLYRDGETLAARVNRFVHGRFGERGEPYVDLAVAAVRATVQGTIVIGLAEGILIGAVYSLAGVPSAVVWAALTGFLAMLPFLAYAAVAGVALALLAQGAGGAALVVAGLGIVLLFSGDKFIRPLLVGRKIKLSFLGVLFGSLGGLETLGLLGLFIGPVVLCLGSAMWRQSTARPGSSERKPA